MQQRPPMRTFRLHFKRGVAREKYENIAQRLGYGWQVQPHKGDTGYITAADVTCRERSAAQFVADRIEAKGQPKTVRTKVVRIEELAVQVPPRRVTAGEYSWHRHWGDGSQFRRR